MNKLKYNTKYQHYTKLPIIRKTFKSGKFPHQYEFISIKENPEVEQFLIENCYWDFLPENSTKIIGIHNLIAFTYLHHPKEQTLKLEVHHIDGNTLNNHPDNLIYLSAEDHRLVTKIQRKLTRLNPKTFYNSKSKKATQFNKRGKVIQNWAFFILGVIAKTIVQTNTFLKESVKVNVKSVLLYIKKYFNYLKPIANLLVLPTKLELENSI